MNNKEKIESLEKYFKDYTHFQLPGELNREVVLRANRFGVQSIYGALIYKQELQAEEKDKEMIKIQKNQTEFNHILALATTVLALGVFIEWMMELFKNPSILIGRSSFIEFVLITIPILVIVLITIELVRIYYLKTNWRREVK